LIFIPIFSTSLVTIMKNSLQKNRFRSNMGTRFLCSNGLGFGDFWSRTDNLKIPKDFFL
jgi:hypothetical protein